MTTTTPSSIAARFVSVDGINTRYFDLGSGEPMVLWHGDDIGGAASASTWNRNLSGLSQSFRVLAADRLGQGLTDNPRSDAEYTAEAIVQHMYGFVRTMGLSGIHMVGQSRGAYFATRLTLEHPELVRTLVIVDTASLAPEVGNAQDRLGKLLADAPTDPREYARFRWSKMSCTTDHITDDYLDEAAGFARLPKMQEARAKMKTLLDTTFLPSLRQQKEETLRWIGEGRLQVPTLVVWGYNDPLAPLPSGHALFELICERLPRARMHIFNRAGHYSYREYPEEFNSVVTSFIKTGR